MINDKSILAIIPARGGSKGIPRKNIKYLNGKPLIAHTIKQGLESKYIDKLVVSTEDKEIAEISERYGAEVPYLRPKELAQDDTPGIAPILDVVNYFDNRRKNFDYVMCLQCTSPLRKSSQIDEAINLLYKSNSGSIVSVCESEVNPYWMKKIVNNKMVDFFEQENFCSRRQDAPRVYRLNGAIYISKRDILLKSNNWYFDVIPYVMDFKTSIDIDNNIDFDLAEFLMNKEGLI